MSPRDRSPVRTLSPRHPSGKDPWNQWTTYTLTLLQLEQTTDSSGRRGTGPPTEPGFSQGFFSILSPMEFSFFAAVASGLLSWGHFISSTIIDLIAHTVTSVKAGVTCVRAMIQTNEDCHVPCGTRLGEFHSLVTQPGEEFTMLESTVPQIKTGIEPCPKPKVDLGQSALNREEQSQLESLISKYSDIFSADDYDYGCTDLVKHTIRTGEVLPVRQRA